MSVRTPVDIIGDEAVAALMAEGWVIRRSESWHAPREGECPVCVPHPTHEPNACKVCGDCPGPSHSAGYVEDR